MSTETLNPQPAAEVKEQSYFDKRMQQLGFNENNITVNLLKTVDGKDALVPVPVFTPNDRGIEITPYTLQRTTIRIEKEGSRMKRNWSIIRYEKPIVKDDGAVIKYLMPKGQGSHPLYTPNIIEAYEQQKEIHTLVLTEGYFKAWKGYLAGLHMIGLPSITHLKDKDQKAIHPDIIKIIDTCNVRHVIWLTDGDCIDISKELETKDALGNIKMKDLYKRPAGFFASVNTFHELLYDYKSIKKYFAYIDIDGIIATHPNQFTRDDLKGLDDLLCSLPDEQSLIADDLIQVSKRCKYFNKHDVTYSTVNARKDFHIDDITQFYLFHLERRHDLKGKTFLYRGTQYNYNDKTGECDVVVPGRAKDYFRVGDRYYKFIEKVNEEGYIEHAFEGRMKGTIIDDHGKKFCDHIPKYEAFCNFPSHTDFHQVIHNNFNVYFPFEHEPDPDECKEEDCPYIIGFIKHIFGEKMIDVPQKEGKPIRTAYYQLALDYIQLMYQKPTVRLPILCLVSRENETGKSTFGNLLKAIFTNNATTVGNNDLADDFNSFWATKLLIMCDETKIDKQAVVEKVKSLTFAKKIGLNAKGKDKVEIPFFGKFMFFTNNEENFIYASEEDLRYWVIKVPKIREKNPDLEKLMHDEIPSFLSFLNHRKLLAPRMTRMWFDPDLLRTEALKKVIAYSSSTVKKELQNHLRSMFLDFGVDTIEMSLKVIKENFFKSKEENYIERVLKEEMHMLPYHKYVASLRATEQNTTDHATTVAKQSPEFDTEAEALQYVKEQLKLENDLEALRFIKRVFKVKRYSYPRLEMKTNFQEQKHERIVVWISELGRPYIFKRKDFLKDDEDSDVPADLKPPEGPAPAAAGGWKPIPENNSDSIVQELPY